MIVKTVVRPETEMKNSGIEYIGKIPNDWEVRKVGYLVAKITDYVASGSFATLAQNVQYLDEPDYARLIRTVDLSGSVNKQPVYVSKEAYKFLSNSNLFGGELILPNIGSVGCVYQYKKIYEHATLAPNSILLDMKENNRFYFYWFSNPIVGESLKILGNSTVQVKFNKSQLRQYMLPRPPLSEQQAIADYLDETCSKIDEIIAEAKASIDEYKELKQSVIFEAVTKGLDKNVEMKGSGSYWIGDIPLTWSTIKTKYVIKIENGSDPSTEGDTPVYGSGANSFKTCGEYKVGPTVLLGRKGATLHIPHYIEGKYWNVDTAFNTTSIEKRINLKYFYYVAFCFDYNRYISQTTLPGMTQTSYRNIYIPYPPMNVQNRIVLWLDNKIDELDSLITEKESLIKDLESYKKSLIYEVVTGKRRVV